MSRHARQDTPRERLSCLAQASTASVPSSNETIITGGGNSIPSLAAGLGSLGAFVALVLTAVLLIKLKLRSLDRDRAEEDATHTIGLVGLTMDVARELPSASLAVPLPTAEEQGPPPSVTTIPEQEEDSKYPFPVGPDKDGNFGVETINLSMESNSSIDFMELCKQFNLAHSGTKPVRWERLISFSNGGMEKWRASLLLPARIAHKGIRSPGVTSGGVTKAKKRKPTYLRARLLNANASRPVNTSVVGLSVQRSKDTRSQAEIDGILPWCRRVLAMISNAKPRVLRHTHLQERRTNSMSIGNSDLFENLLFADRVAAIVEAQLAALASSTGVASTTLSPRPSIDIDAASLGLTAHHSVDIFDAIDQPDSPTIPSFERLSLGQATLPTFPPPQVMPAFSPPAKGHNAKASDAVSSGCIQCILQFADGTSLSVDQGAVPPTKPFRYASDLTGLIASWDDGSPEWNPTSDYPIKIYGRPIPIRLWRDIYCRNEAVPGEWKRLKHVWGLWHEFMKSYRALTPDRFWARFSHQSGQRFSFSRISDILREERKEVDGALAQRAIDEYGDRFVSEFGYPGRNRCTWVTMEDAPKIAQLYRKKKGMVSQDDD
ncbi:uncharacterized protein ARMOST_17230 [Armillaria ostoyae]|uniref:SAP domain-containing protein n=1 Tax=Armillaria ostoyae TaxID=47428 RepID=A0A284RYF6_ARMOS|nr:uncharacterized protein ARMOST_17230 [Armillaria ostoyae]